MSPDLIALLLFAALLLFMFIGLPVAFCLMGVSLAFAVIFISPNSLYMVITSLLNTALKDILLASPLFIFLAVLIQYSGIGTDLYDLMYKWSGPLNGGMAMGTVAMCTLIAAMTGLGGTGVVTMGMIGLPEMLKRGYDKYIAVGCIPAGGSLGPLIPPSILFVILGGMTGLSIGKLFLSGVFSGLVMSFLFCLYIGVRCYLNPKLGPALPKEERATWGEKFAILIKLLAPMIVVASILGTIYTGIATPTEAAGIGAFTMFLICIVKRTLTWQNLKAVVWTSLKINVMVMWLLAGGICFATFLGRSGVGGFVSQVMASLPGGNVTIIAVMLAIPLFLGMLMDGGAIIMICIPIFFPVVLSSGIDPIWFGCIFTMSLIIGYLSPPFGMNLFYTKGILPVGSGITMRDIWVAVMPFIGCQLISIALVVLFPQLAVWLPNHAG